jgi:hypothetical protein
MGSCDDPRTPEDERFREASFTGTGEGSDSEVHFSMGDRKAMPTCSKTQGWPCLPKSWAQNRGPDDTLVHEMVHASRQMRGQIDPPSTRMTRSSRGAHRNK